MRPAALHYATSLDYESFLTATRFDSCGWYKQWAVPRSWLVKNDVTVAAIKRRWVWRFSWLDDLMEFSHFQCWFRIFIQKINSVGVGVEVVVTFIINVVACAHGCIRLLPVTSVVQRRYFFFVVKFLAHGCPSMIVGHSNTSSFLGVLFWKTRALHLLLLLLLPLHEQHDR